jgi:hypothetical protein
VSAAQIIIAPKIPDVSTKQEIRASDEEAEGTEGESFIDAT